MTDNVFNDGEPIVAVQVSNETVEVDTPSNNTKPKRATRKKAAAKSATKADVPALGVYRLHKDVEMPHLATEQAACFDIRAFIPEGTEVTIYTTDNRKVTRVSRVYSGELEGNSGIVLGAGERALVPTGIIWDIPEGYSVRAHPRSGCSLKEALTLINGEGVIDSDYIKEGYMPLVNHSNVRLFIGNGERCAQVEMVENLKYILNEIEEAPKQKSSRNGGFGHSGKV